MSLFRVGVIPLACVFALSIATAQAQQPAPADKDAAGQARRHCRRRFRRSITMIVVDVQKLLQDRPGGQDGAPA